MGLCASSLTEADRKAMSESAKLDRDLQQTKETENKIFKLLLLGTGESGKSTVFKQMQILYQDGFTDYERNTYRHVIRRNIVESMQTILLGASRFGFKLTSPDADRASKFILDLDPLAADFWTPNIIPAIKSLWRKDESIMKTYANKSRLQIPDSAEYLFDNIDRIGLPEFTPTKNDILRARLRTSGIVERLFKINNIDFKFIDVGGQRNERRKWMHCFEGVTAVIFVAAISEYDQTLYEDEKVNRVHEAITVFETICNNPFFLKTSMILFLNKIDLFRDKINRVPLTVCFPEYEGANNYDEASAYIRDRFVETNQQNKDIFPHFTCATDTNNVERVFEACKKIILRKSLDKLGLTTDQ